jgi:hypothetical protein
VGIGGVHAVELEERIVIWVWAKRWLLVAIGVPLVAYVLDGVADRLEARGGQSSTTRGMHSAADRIRRWREGRRRFGRRTPARVTSSSRRRAA